MKGQESYQNGWRRGCCQDTLHHCVLKRLLQERDGPLLTSDLHVSAVAQRPPPVSSKIYYISLDTRSCCAHANSAPTCSTSAHGRSLPRWREPAWGKWGASSASQRLYGLYLVLAWGAGKGRIARLLGLWSVTQVNEAGFFTDTDWVHVWFVSRFHPIRNEFDTNSTQLRAWMRIR